MEDERLAAINKQKEEAINQSNSLYEGLLTDNENIYNQQKDYAEEYEQTQNSALDKQLAFQENLVNQQKEEARQNMEAEQKRAHLRFHDQEQIPQTSTHRGQRGNGGRNKGAV